MTNLPKIIELENEIKRLSHKVEDVQNINQDSFRQVQATNFNNKDAERLHQQFEGRFKSIEEILSDKASKQSVAQALHRKVNKPEFDEIFAQKADLVDI